MGNSSGGLKEYWDIFYSGTNAQGAFVWDWVDQGIRQPVPGEYQARTEQPRFLAYGGWWEDRRGVRNDNNFNNNGLVAADRTPHPRPVRDQVRLPQPARQRRWISRSGTIRVKNWSTSSTPQTSSRARWEVKADGTTIAAGDASRRSISRRARRRSSRSRCRRSRREPGVEYWLNVSFALEGRHAVGEEGPRGRVGPVRAAVAVARRDRSHAAATALLDVVDDAGSGVRFSGKDFALRFDKADGDDHRLPLQGRDAARARPASRLLARADGQRSRRVETVARFRRRERTRQHRHRTVARREQHVERRDDVKVERSTTAQHRSSTSTPTCRRSARSTTMTYTIDANGDVDRGDSLQARRAPKVPMMPRFGTRAGRRRRAREHRLVRPRSRTRPTSTASSSASDVYRRR